MDAKRQKKKMPNHLKFIFGGLAGICGTIVIQPLDLIKSRMQISGIDGTKRQYPTSFHAFKYVIQNEGILGLYKGLSAGMLRQAVYGTVRLGIYNTLLDNYSKNGVSPNFFTKVSFAMLAGLCGSFAGNPMEVALIRMTLDGRLPEEKRRNYKNAGDALVKIAREEGLPGLWRGAVTTMIRAMVVNASQLATYSQSKEYLATTKHVQEGILLHFYASMISGFVTSVASVPLDIIKTRLQNMKVIDGKTEYAGALDVITKLIEKEGPFALWKGFTPYYLRLGPLTVLIFVFLEQFNAAYYRYV